MKRALCNFSKYQCVQVNNCYWLQKNTRVSSSFAKTRRVIYVIYYTPWKEKACAKGMLVVSHTIAKKACFSQTKISVCRCSRKQPLTLVAKRPYQLLPKHWACFSFICICIKIPSFPHLQYYSPITGPLQLTKRQKYINPLQRPGLI